MINSTCFTNIFANSVLYIDSTTLSYSSFTLDIYENIVEYQNTNLFIYNTTFQNIGCATCVICYKMENIVQNIKIYSSTFSQITTSADGIIKIINTGGFNYNEANGGYINVISNGKTILGYMLPIMTYLSNLKFYDVTYGGYLLYAFGLPNTVISSIKVSATNDMSYNNFNSYVIDNFINNSEDNIQTQVLSGSVNENECLGLLYIDTSSSID